MVIISFDTIQLQRCCCEYAVAEASFGQLDAAALLTLIADIEATTNAFELLELLGFNGAAHDDDSIVLEFGSDLCAVFFPVGTRFKRADSGRVRWQTVSRLKLVRIERRT